MKKLKIKNNKLVRYEADEQKAVLEWAATQRYNGRPLSDYIFHFANEGKRHWKTGNNLKAMGMRKGAPDLVICISVNLGGKIEYMKSWSGLVIEMKSEKGKLTKEQKYCLEIWSEEGFFVKVCRSFEKAKDMIEVYLRMALVKPYKSVSEEEHAYWKLMQKEYSQRILRGI